MKSLATALLLANVQAADLASTKDVVGLDQIQTQPVETLTKEDFAHVLKGMYNAFGMKVDVLALLVCVGDEDKALLAATLGIQAFQ